jgi:basic membrane lipoprotein Med (substrate-binding protein (PBP1-ABC) superfamily)
LALVAVIVGLVWRGHQTEDPASVPAESLPRVDFILSGPIHDLAYDYRHYLGHRVLQARLRGEVDSRVHANVSASAFEETTQKLCRSGTTLIFSTNETYARVCRDLAEAYPDVAFMQFTANPKWLTQQRPANVALYGIRDWEGAYVCGAVAAHALPEDNAFGFLAPHPGPPTVWVANAFALGCQSVNPDAEVQIFYANSWHDREAERTAVEAMATRQIGAVYFLTSFPAAAMAVAERSGMHVLTHYCDLSGFAPTGWLTGCLWQWSSLYERATRQVLAGQRLAGAHWGGFREGRIALAPFGPDVSGTTMQAAWQIIDQLRTAERSVFAGPIHDNRGALRVPAGSRLSDRDILSCNWLARGIGEFTIADGAAKPLD